MDCNQLAVDIDNEIGIVYNFIRDKYRTKFPELESLVRNPLEYAKVVQAIGECLVHIGASFELEGLMGNLVSVSRFVQASGEHR